MRQILATTLFLVLSSSAAPAAGKEPRDPVKEVLQWSPERIQKALDYWVEQQLMQKQTLRLKQQMQTVVNSCDTDYCEWT